MQNELAEAYSSPNQQTDQMASQGRKGDAMMAHVTPGDYVIPKDILVQHPDFLVKLKKVMSDENEDYRTHMVGSGFESINPETGAPEFGFGNIGGMIGKAIGKIAGNKTFGPLSNPIHKASIPSPLKPIDKFASKSFDQFNGQLNEGIAGGMGYVKSNGIPNEPQAPYSPSEMKLPGSLQELGGLTDEQRRSYLATQGSQGEGLGGNARDYYANLLQRNIQADKGALMPVESQYLSTQGVNSSLSGQQLIDALRGF
jgi:hypothetical protein